MKKIFNLIFILAVGLTTAQNKDTKKADQLYDGLAYTDAAAAYQKLLKKGKGSSYVFKQLANSYFLINDTKKAETYYKRVARGRKVDAETVYNYAQSLKANGKVSDHNTWMKKFAEMKPDDSRSKDFMKNPNYVPKILEEFQLYSTKNMEGLNTPYSEFGGMTSGKDFYFSSARNTSRKKYHWNEEPFLDVYKANIVGGTVKNATLLSGEVNTKFHEGNVAITADGKRMYFDRNDYYRGKYDKSEDGVNQINLFYAEKIDGEWKGVQSVPFNSSEYSTGHPALSPDGNTLYFVSDMPGGKGGSDIYKVSIDSNGSFGKPMNLGDAINTEGKEVFPYIDSLGNFYFSSDGHLGLGGLDAFVAEASGSGFGSPVNMGAGANSGGDDFAVIFEPSTGVGYLSSNRSGGKGGDDIYTLTRNEPPCEVTMNVTVINEYTKEPILGARVDLYDTMENKLSTMSSAEDGSSKLMAECDKGHVVQGFMRGFESNAITVDASGGGAITQTIELRPIEAIIEDDKVILNPILFDLDRHNIKPQAAFELDKLIEIMNKYPNMVIKVESHTDNRGQDNYNMNLSEKRAQSTVQYVISKGIDSSRISGQGFGESQPIVDCGGNCSEEEYHQNRRSEFVIVSR